MRQAIDQEQHAIRQQIDAVIAEVNSHLEYQNGVDNENTIEEHFCGLMNVVCMECGSRNSDAERPPDQKFTKCCQKGKVHLPAPEHQYPILLQSLLQNDHMHSANFREHI